MKCRCGGEMRLHTRDVLGKWGPDGRDVIIRGVPVWVCECCGEEVLERDDSRKLEDLLQAQSVPGEQTETVPVRAFPSRQHA